MADRKISDLTALTAPAAGDYLPIVDISEVAAASKNKRITIEELFRGVPLGTAAAPSIAIEGDENTGIYSPGADQLAVATNGTGRLFIDATGNVGVAAAASTWNLGKTLEVSGTKPVALWNPGDGFNALSNTYYNSGYKFSTTGGYGLYYQQGTASGAHIFATTTATGSANGAATFSETLRITAAGLVGVGTSSPVGKLAVGNSSNNFLVSIDSSASYAEIQAYNAPLYINRQGNNTILNLGGGSVGIGASSPSARLHISDLTASAVELMRLQVNLTSPSGNKSITWADSTNVVGRISLDYTSPTAKMRFGSLFNSGYQTSDLMTLTPTGLGIGTSSPGAIIHSAPAAVNGGLATAFLATQAGAGVNTGTALRFGWGSSDGSFSEISAALQATGVGTNLDLKTSTDNSTAASTKVRITSAGLVGIGTTAPFGPLSINNNALPAASGNINSGLVIHDSTIGRALNLGVSESGGYSWIKSSYVNNADAANPLAFFIGATERCRLDGSGRLLVGTSTARANLGGGTLTAGYQMEGVTNNNNRYQAQIYNAADVGSPIYTFAKSRGTSVGSNTVVQADDQLGILAFEGADGTNFIRSVAISAQVDGTPGANDMPGRLVFSTTADGAASPTERMRITNGGAVWLNTTTGTIGTTAFGTVFAGDGVGSFRTSRNVNGVDHVAIVSGNAGIFVVRGDGDCENTNNSYGAVSDVKLKENIINASSQWNDISALQVRNYNFKTETGYRTHTQIGLVAQEVELVSPGLVSESPDRDAEGNDLGTVTKSVNYSVLYMKAVKALQEAMERIEQLEAEMAEVKAQLS